MTSAPAEPAPPAAPAPTDTGTTTGGHTATPTSFLAPASAPARAAPSDPAADGDLIPVEEDPPDLAAGEQAIPADGVPDQYIPPDTPEELADEAIANGPDDPADTTAAPSTADTAADPSAAARPPTRLRDVSRRGVSQPPTPRRAPILSSGPAGESPRLDGDREDPPKQAPGPVGAAWMAALTGRASAVMRPLRR